jgi:hypothetical protein
MWHVDDHLYARRWEDLFKASFRFQMRILRSQLTGPNHYSIEVKWTWSRSLVGMVRAALIFGISR